VAHGVHQQAAGIHGCDRGAVEGERVASHGGVRRFEVARQLAQSHLTRAYRLMVAPDRKVCTLQVGVATALLLSPNPKPTRCSRPQVVPHARSEWGLTSEGATHGKRRVSCTNANSGAGGWGEDGGGLGDGCGGVSHQGGGGGEGFGGGE
jgi:hypothetical protein